MPTVEEWTLAVISNVVHFGFIIAILYTLGRFYKYRYLQALEKRSPLLVYLMNICFIFYLLNHITYKIAYIHGEVNFDIDPILTDNEAVGHHHIISLISVICYIFSLHGMAIMFIARSWIIYFNSKYGLEVQKSEWSVHLNDTYPDTLWFVKHRKDFGSNRVIYTIAIISYLGQATLAAFFTFMYPDIQRIYDMACWLIEFIVLVIIWNRIPSFNDIFGLKKEISWMFRVAGIALTLYIGWTVKLIIMEYDLWIFMIAQFIFGVMVGMMALILNGFIFYHSDYKQLVSSLARLPKRRTRTLSDVPLPNGSKISCSNATPTQTQTPITTSTAGGSIHTDYNQFPSRLGLQQVLESNDLIQCFFNHLTDEFSVELLLAFIEFKQFHDLMINDEEFMGNIQHIITAKSDDSIPILSLVSLADELPKSKIVYENKEDIDRIERYLGIAQDLFYKYVTIRAEFEINISYGCKQQIAYFIQEHIDLSGAALLSKGEQYKLYVLFDKASETLYRLMQASHDRCIKANRYSPTSIPNSV